MAGDRILLALDGEPHTRNAIEWALELAGKLRLTVVAVHVKDPYLKQFYNDIYAQGREEYLAHVDRALEDKAVRTVAAFERRAKISTAVRYEIRVLTGETLEALVEESRDSGYRVVILGRKPDKGRLDAWRSRNLPRLMNRAIRHLPIMVVPVGSSSPL